MPDKNEITNYADVTQLVDQAINNTYEEDEDPIDSLIYTLRTIGEIIDSGLCEVKVYSNLLIEAAEALEELQKETLTHLVRPNNSNTQ